MYDTETKIDVFRDKGAKKKGRKHSMELLLELYPLWLKSKYPLQRLGFHVLDDSLTGDRSLYNQRKTQNNSGLICTLGTITDMNMCPYYWDICQPKVLFSSFVDGVFEGDIDVDVIDKFLVHMDPHVKEVTKLMGKKKEKAKRKADTEVGSATKKTRRSKGGAGDDDNFGEGIVAELTSTLPNKNEFVKRAEKMTTDKKLDAQEVFESIKYAFDNGWITKISYSTDLGTAYASGQLKGTGYFQTLTDVILEEKKTASATGNAEKDAKKNEKLDAKRNSLEAHAASSPEEGRQERSAAAAARSKIAAQSSFLSGDVADAEVVDESTQLLQGEETIRSVEGGDVIVNNDGNEGASLLEDPEDAEDENSSSLDLSKDEGAVDKGKADVEHEDKDMS